MGFLIQHATRFPLLGEPSARQERGLTSQPRGPFAWISVADKYPSKKLGDFWLGRRWKGGSVGL